MKNSDKKNSVDLEELVLKFWPQINYRVRNSLGYTNPDWEDVASEVLIDIIESSPQTVDALMKLDLPAGVDVEIKV